MYGHVNNPWWVPTRARRKELIDSPDHPLEDFRQSFRDIRTINRLFGGTAVVLTRLSRLVGSSREKLTVLDVGTGSADIPRALMQWARERGISIRMTASDANPKVLRFAQADGPEDPDFRFVVCDATALPFENESFDYVLSSLTFHHFDDGMAGDALREMCRVARRAVIVNDLRRAYLPAALIWLVTRALGMNRLTRHDGPLSVLRSRTMREFRDLATLSGPWEPELYGHPFWRAAIVLRKAG